MFGIADILVNAREAVSQHTRKHAVAVWQESPGKTPCIGSSTCIEINDRLFLSTAAHNFQDIRKGGKVTFYSANSTSRIPLKTIGHNYSKHGAKGTLDAAWIELDPLSAAQEDLVGVSLEIIDAYHVMDLKDGNYEIVGLPMQLHRVTENNTHYTVPLLTYNTIPGKKAKLGDDELYLDYSETSVSNSGVVTMPHPGGISGGGIWSVPLVGNNQIWSAAKYRLAGIATNYTHFSGEIAGHIVGIRMYHWLKLLYADLPELRQHLDPLLNQTP